VVVVKGGLRVGDVGEVHVVARAGKAGGGDLHAVDVLLGNSRGV